MAKKIKFPLKLKDDFPVRSLDELKFHFDFDKILGYFLDGKLLTWLEDRNYTSETDAIRTLQRNDANLKRKLFAIFGVEDSITDSNVDITAIEARNKKIAILRQYASDENILNHPEQVALNQEDLDKLIEEDKFNDIYLCNNSFVIKLIKRKHYIGIGKVEAVVKDAEGSNFEGVSFSNVSLDAQSMLNIGLAYDIHAQNTQDDFFNAMEWYKKAADSGNIAATLNIGILYLHGKGVLQDEAKAFELIRQAADKGNIYATYCVGVLYHGGNGISKNSYKALEWFEKAAELGNKDAPANIAHMYRNGDGIPRDCYKAIEWFKKATDLGDASAAFNIAYMYRDGEGIPKDAYKAIEWFKKAAELGDPKALHTIGYMYDIGNCGVAKDPCKALEWFEKAASLGVSDSMKRIGNFYEYGKEYGYGVPADIHKAMEWYKKAAELDDTDAMCSIGSIYRVDAGKSLYGENVIVKNIVEGYHKALEWYKKAADIGNTYAMYNIASLYQSDAESQYGAFINGYQKAIEWYRKIIETSSDTTSFEFEQAKEQIPKLEAILR